MSSSPRTDEASILSRAIDPDSGGWAPGVAQGILSLTLSAPDRPVDRALEEQIWERARSG